MAHSAKHAPQLWLLAGAGLLWAAAPTPSFAALLGAYVLAWLLGQWALRRARIELSSRVAWTAATLALLVPAAGLYRAAPELAQAEGLLGITENVRDRLRLEDTPSIAPPVVFGDHPQEFWVHAPGGQVVSVAIGSTNDFVDADALGEGLFRLPYLPRVHGSPDGGDHILVTLRVDGVDTDRLLRYVRPAAHPRWLRASPGKRHAAVPSEETDEVAVITRTGLSHRIPTADGPTDVAFWSAERLVVAHRWTPELWVIDVATGSRVAQQTTEAGQVRLAVSRDKLHLAVAIAGARNAIRVLSVPELEPEARIPLPFAPAWLEFGRDGDTLVVSERHGSRIHRFHRGTGGWAEDAVLDLGRTVMTMARASHGSRLYVATTDLISDGQPHLGNHFIQDQILTIETTRFAVTAQELTQRRSPRQGNPGDIDRGAGPLGLAEASGGNLLIAFSGSDEVWQHGRNRPEPLVMPLDDLDLRAPHGVAELEGRIVAVTSPSSGTIGLLNADGGMRRLIRLAPADDDLLTDNQEELKRRVGEQGFYEATRSGVSCNSCHLHGDRDGAGHNIGGGFLAPTLTVAGIIGTAPYLRDASFPRIRDLDELSSTVYRGFRRRLGDRGTTLEAYVLSRPRHRAPATLAPHDLELERAGYTVFRDAGCPTCHAPPAFSNLSLHPVGALFPDAGYSGRRQEVVDTPSLLSVGAAAPYLHDGRAEDLESIVREHNEANRHGDTANLSDEDVDALVRFLSVL